MNGLHLEVSKGEIFGLIGPNGAGKTTVFMMLSTLLKPTSGTARVAGFDVVRERDAVRRRIGVLFQEAALDHQLTPRENLDFHGRLHHMGKQEIKERTLEVLRLVELDGWRDEPIRTLSGGMRRRLEIARALMHRPEVLLLDEPTHMLDPKARYAIWSYVKELNEREGMTILLATNVMEEAEQLCRRLIVIDSGRSIAVGTIDELRSVVGNDIVSLKVAPLGNILTALEALDGIDGVKIVGDGVDLKVKDGEKMIPQILQSASSLGITISSVSLRKPTLGDVFVHYTGRGLGDQPA